MTKEKLSVIIPAYNEEKRIGKTYNDDRIWLILSHIQNYPERKKELASIEKELSKTYVREDIIRFFEIKIYLYVKK